MEVSYVKRVEEPHGLPRGELQVRDGAVRRDVEYEEWNVVVEVDGRLGHEGEYVAVDRRRDRRAAGRGRVTLRAGWVDVEGDPCEGSWHHFRARRPGMRRHHARPSGGIAIVARMTDQIGTPGGTPERPALFFADAAEFGRWLERHHATDTELWMGFYRKHHPDAGLQWAEAVREALCWGWIDSMAQGIDEHTRRQRWTPRKKGSNWSAINIAAVAELTEAGRMQPAGLAAFALRREDRSGVYAYETRELELTPAYAAMLEADVVANAFWGAATNSYRKLAVNWVMTAKQEKTRDSRMTQLVADCAAGQMIKSQRYGATPAWVARAAAAGAAAGMAAT